MAFRFQSAVAGFAKRGSLKLDKLDEDYRDNIKTTAASLAKESSDIRKKRMEAVTSYNSAARKLKTRYNLNDAQIQTLLSSGLDGLDAFESAIKTGQQDAVLRKQKFDARTYAQGLFFETDSDATNILSLADQAQEFASRTVPSTLDLESAAKGVAAATQTRFTGVSDDAAQQAIVGRMGTPVPASYTGPVAGETGLGVKGLGGMSEAEKIQLQTEAAGLDLRRAQVQSTNLSNKATKIGNRFLEQEKNLGLEIMSGKINQAAADLGLTSVRAQNLVLKNEDLQNKLDTFEEFGVAKEKASLQLLNAKIIKTNRFSNLEQAQTAYIVQASNVRSEIDDIISTSELGEADPRLNDLRARQFMFEELAGDMTSVMIANDVDGKITDPFSKVSPTSTFNSMLKTTLGGQNVEGDFDAAGNFKRLTQGQMPAYFTAHKQATEEFSKLYGKYDKGQQLIEAKNQQLEELMKKHVREESFAALKPEDFSKTGDQFAKAVSAKRQAAIGASDERTPSRSAYVDFGAVQYDSENKTSVEEAEAKLKKYRSVAKAGDVVRVNGVLLVVGTDGEFLGLSS